MYGQDKISFSSRFCRRRFSKQARRVNFLSLPLSLSLYRVKGPCLGSLKGDQDQGQPIFPLAKRKRDEAQTKRRATTREAQDEGLVSDLVVSTNYATEGDAEDEHAEKKKEESERGRENKESA